MSRVGLYVRVSTDEQRDHGFSIDNQLRLLEEHCERNKYNIIDVYNDAGYSGKNLIRPNMQRLIKDINDKKIDKLLAIKVDRLTRDGHDGYWLLKHCEENDVKIELILEPYDVTTANGEMIFGINLIFGQRERKEIGARTKRGLEEMALQKRHPNKAPYGYCKNEKTGRLEINPVEAIVVKEIFELCALGKSTRGIANKLHGRYFSESKRLESKIYNILRNEIYTGTFYFGKTHRKKEDVIVVNDYCEPIIDYDLFEKAQLGIERNRHPNYGTHVHMFSAMVKCPECGNILSSTISYKYHKDKTLRKKYFFLLCRNSKCSLKGQHYNTQKLEDKLVKMLDKLDIHMLEHDFGIVMPNDDKDEEVARIEQAINQLEIQEKKLADLYLNSNLNVEIINQKNEMIRSEQETLKEKLKELTKDNVVNLNVELLQKLDLSNMFKVKLGSIWNDLHKKLKKDIINKYIISIEIARTGDYDVEIKDITFNKEFFKEEYKKMMKFEKADYP